MSLFLNRWLRWINDHVVFSSSVYFSLLCLTSELDENIRWHMCSVQTWWNVMGRHLWENPLLTKQQEKIMETCQTEILGFKYMALWCWEKGFPVA